MGGREVGGTTMSTSRRAQGSNIHFLHLNPGNVELAVRSKTCCGLPTRHPQVHRSSTLPLKRARLAGTHPRPHPQRRHPSGTNQLPQVKFLPSNCFFFILKSFENQQGACLLHMENSPEHQEMLLKTVLTHVSVAFKIISA